MLARPLRRSGLVPISVVSPFDGDAPAARGEPTARRSIYHVVKGFVIAVGTVYAINTLSKSRSFGVLVFCNDAGDQSEAGNQTSSLPRLGR